MKFTYQLLREDNPERIKQLAIATKLDDLLLQSIEIENNLIKTTKPLPHPMYDNLSRQSYIAPNPAYQESREVALLLELGDIALPEIDRYLLKYGFDARNILIDAIRWSELPGRLHNRVWKAINKKYIQLTLPFEEPTM